MEINIVQNLDIGKAINNDIKLLNNMGFDNAMINKVYILLKPVNFEKAVDYMTEINGIYQHEFLYNPYEPNLCFICKKPKNNHINNIPNNLLNDTQKDSDYLLNETQNNFNYFIPNDLINEDKKNNITHLQNIKIDENLYNNKIQNNNNFNFSTFIYRGNKVEIYLVSIFKLV